MARPDITVGSDYALYAKMDGFLEASKHMAAEFRRKKKAFELNNRSSKTIGSVDPRRISRYKTSNDIFRRKVYTPEGKSHGVCVLLDTSGSMYGRCYDAAISQAVMISIFCKQLKIPFSVITFTNSYESVDYEVQKKKLISPHHFMMNEILHTGMSVDQIESFYSLYNIMHEGSRPYRFLAKNTKLNAVEINLQLDKFRELFAMAGTPLFDAIACTLPVMHDMAIRHKVQNMNLLTITDGQSNSLSMHSNVIVHPYTGARARIPNTGNYSLNYHIALNTLLGMEKIKHHTLYIASDYEWEEFHGHPVPTSSHLHNRLNELFGVKKAAANFKPGKGVLEFTENVAGFTSCFVTSPKAIAEQENMNLFAKLIAQQFTANFE